MNPEEHTPESGEGNVLRTKENFGNGEVTLVYSPRSETAQKPTILWFQGMDDIYPKGVDALAFDVNELANATQRNVLAIAFTGERTNNSPLKRRVSLGGVQLAIPQSQLSKTEDMQAAMGKLHIEQAHAVGYCLGAVPATMISEDPRVTRLTYLNPIGMDDKSLIRSAGRAVYGLGKDILSGRRKEQHDGDDSMSGKEARSRSLWAHFKQYHADGWTVLGVKLHKAPPEIDANYAATRMLSGFGDNVYPRRRLEKVLRRNDVSGDSVKVVELEELGSHVLGKGEERKRNLQRVGAEILAFEAEQ